MVAASVFALTPFGVAVSSSWEAHGQRPCICWPSRSGSLSDRKRCSRRLAMSRWNWAASSCSRKITQSRWANRAARNGRRNDCRRGGPCAVCCCLQFLRILAPREKTRFWPIGPRAGVARGAWRCACRRVSTDVPRRRRTNHEGHERRAEQAQSISKRMFRKCVELYRALRYVPPVHWRSGRAA